MSGGMGFEDNTFFSDELWAKCLAKCHDFGVRTEDRDYVARCRKCGAPWVGPGEYAECPGTPKPLLVF